MGGTVGLGRECWAELLGREFNSLPNDEKTAYSLMSTSAVTLVCGTRLIL